MAAGMEANVAPRRRPQNGLNNVPVANPKPVSTIPEMKKKANNNNVTVAVNYSRPHLERFVSHYQPKLSSSSSEKKTKNNPTTSAGKFDIIPSNFVNPTTAPAFENSSNFSESLNINDVEVDSNENRTNDTNTTGQEKTPTSAKSERRRTKRQPKPRQVSVEKSCRRYDMNAVPNVKRNVGFLKQFRRELPRRVSLEKENAKMTLRHVCASEGENRVVLSESVALLQNEDKKPLNYSTSHPEITNNVHGYNIEGTQQHHHQQQHRLTNVSPCSVCNTRSNNQAIPTPATTPFFNDESVIWVPSSRSEWDDCVDEMTAVCFAAAIRRHAATESSYSKSKRPPPTPPLSRAYIRDRIDIDDPLRGYQIRHKTGGWLQGFVLMTNFTTWTHYFKWDSMDPKSGILSENNDESVGLDDDGTLSAQLESQERSGDPLSGGVVWPTLAEISLVGALGCGEYLLQMALNDIARRGCYEFVVLQATETSRPFYERFGFVRVGAVTKYGSKELFSAEQQQHQCDPNGGSPNKYQQQKPETVAGSEELQVVGYRHWTYANETTQRLNKHHGGPSYMMVRRVTQEHIGPKSILDELSPCFSTEKPIVKALGTSLTPTRKKKKPAVALTNGEIKSPDQGNAVLGTVANAKVGGRKLKLSPSSRKRSIVVGNSPAGGESVPHIEQSKKQKIEIVSSCVDTAFAVTERTLIHKPDIWGAAHPPGLSATKSKCRGSRPQQEAIQPPMVQKSISSSLISTDSKKTKKENKPLVGSYGTTKQRKLSQKGSIVVRISMKRDQQGKPTFEIKDFRCDVSSSQGEERNLSLSSRVPVEKEEERIGNQSGNDGVEELMYEDKDTISTGRPPISTLLEGKPSESSFSNPKTTEEELPEKMSDFIYKQRHDIWLAVPHQDSSKIKAKRKPPRQRGDVIMTGNSPSEQNIRPAISMEGRQRKEGKRKLPQCREENTLHKTPPSTKEKSRRKGAPQLTSKSPISQLRPKVTTPVRASRKGLLRKQKNINQYRDPKKTYYFNRVVSPKAKTTSNEAVRNETGSECTQLSKPFYFVLNYNEKDEMMQIIPLQPCGTFFGKRQGRIRWKATVVEKPLSTPEADPSDLQEQWYDSMGVTTVSCAGWNIVSAYAVIKTADVAEESWDIFG